MQHKAFVDTSDIRTGSVISIAAATVQLDDVLAIEFPNNDRVGGRVVTTSINELDIEIGPATWRLRPHAPSDTSIHNNVDEFDGSYWTVQALL